MAETEIILGALVTDMKKRLEGLTKREPYTFSRVPAFLFERNKNLYEPTVISIGPYHHHVGHLQTTEEHKWRYLWDLLDRPTTTASLENCVRKTKDLEQKARQCYDESIILSSDEFVKLMVVDACFIIEFFLKSDGPWTSNIKGRGLQLLRLDLLLFENQIPFFIIEELFKLVFPGDESSRKTLIELIRSAYRETSLLEGLSPTLPPPAQIHHLLHLYYHWFVSAGERSRSERPSEKPISLNFSCFPSMKSETSETSGKLKLHIPSATELSEAGVTFTKKGSPGHNLDITFWNGQMETPFIQIGDFLKLILTNLVAFEQSISDDGGKVTSFSLLMDSLINTEKDVAILQQCGIINNLLGSGEEVALFFNQLCQYATLSEDHYFGEMFEQVNRYCDSKWHRHRARLVHDYFSSPWSILSLIAALVLLAFTFLQTFFAIYSYFRPPN